MPVEINHQKLPNYFFGKKGFTLIELMMAISIIAILTVIGVVVYSGLQKSARDNRRLQDMKLTQNALEQYYAANRTYPAKNGVKVLNSTNLPELNSYFEKGAPPSDPVNSGSNIYNYYQNDSGGTVCPGKYMVCAVMENCSTASCNRTAAPTTGCDAVFSGAPTIGAAGWYCTGSLSN